MRILVIICSLLASFTTARAQENYDDIVASFELDSVTITAVYLGQLDPGDFIRLTMDDTTLFSAFSLLKRMPYKMHIESTIYDKKRRKKAWKTADIQQFVQDRCRFQAILFDSIQGNFYDKDGVPYSETLDMFEKIFTIDKKTCDVKPIKAPQGIAVLSKPKDIKQQRELIKRLLFAPHTLRVEVPFFGNKMKTDIFSSPTSDYYQFKVYKDVYRNRESVYVFDIQVDTVKYPNWEKEVLIKSMRTSFRAYDLQVMERSYELYYPGTFASCDLNIKMSLFDINGYIMPRFITYSGKWKFPTKGTDISDISIEFYDIQTQECIH